MREKGKHGRWRARLTAFLGAALGLAILSIADARADERIVSVGGAVTEIIYALGRDALIAAVDTTSLYPPEALKTKPNVGYMRALSAEGVLSVRPSLIVAAEGAGPPAALTSLRESGVRLATIPNEASPAGVQRKILAVGELIGSSEGARMLAKEVDARFTTLAALRDRIEKPKRVLFVLSASGGRTMIGGTGTSADAIIALAGATNAAASIEGFKPMNDEAIVAAAPDVVLTMRRENASARPDGDAGLRRHARGQGPSHSGNGRQLSPRLGPRAPDAARDLMAALNPEMKLPPLPPGNANHGHEP